MKKGFTLIELLVVVAIIGILSTIVISSLGKARLKSQIASANATISQIKTLVVGAQLNNGQNLRDITASSCTRCSCPTGVNLTSLASSHACFANWQSAVSSIASEYEGSSVTATQFSTDPWGSPYLLDENEGELPANPCRRDALSSAGPDRIRFTADDINVALAFANCS